MDVLKKLADRLFEKRPDEDIVDRANNSATPFLLICCAIVVFAKEYGPVSEPMYCWTQAEFNEQWMEYIHEYCFVESTYYVPFNESVPLAEQRNNGTDRLNYYQWVPFILVAMALFSQFTHYFWSFCNMLSEKDLPSILRKVSAVVFEGDEQQANFAEAIASHFHVVLLACDSSKKRRRKSPFLRGIFARNWLAFVYLFTKFLYLIANIVQFKFISMFLGVDKLPNWGWTMLNSFLTHGSSWEQSGHFPRVTLCDLKIRQPNERFHEFTVQCVLVANFLNEKIFLMLYFWFILMAFVSLLSLAEWCWTLLFRSQNRFIKRLIELSLLQMIPDPEFDFGYADTRRDESGTDECGAETEDGDELEGRQHGHFTAVAPEISAAKAENVCDDNQSGSPSNNSTATMEEIEQHAKQMLRNSAAGQCGATDGKVKGTTRTGTDHFECSAAVDQHPQQQQRLSNNNKTNSNNLLQMKWDEDDQIVIELQKKRNALYRDFKKNKNEFMTFLGVDGIMVAKMMCSSAGMQMTSLVMGRLLCAFLQHDDNKTPNDQPMLPV
ncbi:hypothetical protein niasHT_038443 [Heterodera trifolii]|uniref:Innexin n=1 Tax=Heterodera trifolii TaxID=157864 RepID=A0ABD2HXE4_9BILA